MVSKLHFCHIQNLLCSPHGLFTVSQLKPAQIRFIKTFHTVKKTTRNRNQKTTDLVWRTKFIIWGWALWFLEGTELSGLTNGNCVWISSCLLIALSGFSGVKSLCFFVFSIKAKLSICQTNIWRRPLEGVCGFGGSRLSSKVFFGPVAASQCVSDGRPVPYGNWAMVKNPYKNTADQGNCYQFIIQKVVKRLKDHL